MSPSSVTQAPWLLELSKVPPEPRGRADLNTMLHRGAAYQKCGKNIGNQDFQFFVSFDLSRDSGGREGFGNDPEPSGFVLS